MTACSGNQTVVKIEGQDSLHTLFVQKVEGQASSEELTRTVKDEEKINKTLEMVEGLEIEKSSSEHVFSEMKSQNTYMFAFSKGEEMKSSQKVPYAFSVLEDGTFMFTHKGVAHITTEKHKELLERLIQLLDLPF